MDCTLEELRMHKYTGDTTASAVVLRELGEAYFSNFDNNDLVFEYHVKIKILSKEGLKHSNFEIPLYKRDGRTEKWIRIEGRTYNLNNQSLTYEKFDPKSVFKQTVSEYVDLIKFTLPAVRVGSVIDVKYVIESPFIFNFKEWDFQSELPKVQSEFWAKIPANYNYNIALRGYMTLTEKEGTLIKDCFSPGGGVSADCSFYKFKMNNIPAFKEEDFITSKENLLSRMSFELIEIKDFNGRTFRYTKEWKDVEAELRTHEDFGLQIKKAKNLFDDKLPEILKGKLDQKARAQAVYDFVANLFQWNSSYGKYAEKGIRKAYETKTGNIADINLTLIAILQEAGFDASPVLLSTRDHGFPIKLYPVLSSFNYVVAHVTIDNQIYLLDASESDLPFGYLPERCLNGEGRLISKENASWVSLSPKSKRKKQTLLNLKLDSFGKLEGILEVRSFNYEAISQRRTISKYSDRGEYLQLLSKKWPDISITDYELENFESIEKPLTEKMKVEFRLESFDPKSIFVNLGFLSTWKENPLKSANRLYPVDFGIPIEYLNIVSIQYPEGYFVDEKPKDVAIALPEGGGKYTSSVSNLSGKLSIVNGFHINKSEYSSLEYHGLRELFHRVIVSQSEMIVLKKNN
ncbi:MAG: DUF3857 domain-containing protein [Flammeovirgaceae bacterium]